MQRINTLQDKGVSLTHLEKGITLKDSKLHPVSANAYMGCWGIVEALDKGAEIVVTGRVADTSIVMGPAAYHFAWDKDNWDMLAGAAAAGHSIECSGQAAGGNFSYFEEVKSFKNVGFPIAEIDGDGACINAFLHSVLSIEKVKELLPDLSEFEFIDMNFQICLDSISMSWDYCKMG